MRKLVVLFLAILFLSGCTTTEKGVTLGALGGATAGGAIGYFAGDQETEDAVTGAAVGAITGAIAGGIIGYFTEE